jgi:hypothetical protein
MHACPSVPRNKKTKKILNREAEEGKENKYLSQKLLRPCGFLLV